MSPKTRILDGGLYWTNGQPLPRRIQSMRNMAAALADHYANPQRPCPLADCSAHIVPTGETTTP